MFASRVSTNPKCVAHLPSLLEVVLASKNTMNNPFLGLGHALGVGLSRTVTTTVLPVEEDESNQDPPVRPPVCATLANCKARADTEGKES